MRNLRIALAATGLAVALTAGHASAQVQVGEGLVVVNLTVQDVIDDIKIALNVSNVPVTVQAPIGVAATVCDVNANVLAAQRRNGGAECTAQNTSTALNHIVQRQMTNQNQ